jgi:hypothetical protein
MVGSSQRDSCRTSLLYLAAALLACDVALAQPEITVVDRASITAEHLGTSSTTTHHLNLSVVHLEGSGWEPARFLKVLRQATAILVQCDIGVRGAEWVSLSAPPRYLDFSTPVARELAVAAPVRRPAIYLVRNTLNRPAFQAEAIGRGNSRTRPELADTVWITVGTRDPGIALAHELAHVLMNSGEHSDEPDNLMRNETSGANTKLSAAQCERMRSTATENGLLQR